MVKVPALTITIENPTPLTLKNSLVSAKDLTVTLNDAVEPLVLSVTVILAEPAFIPVTSK